MTQGEISPSPQEERRGERIIKTKQRRVHLSSASSWSLGGAEPTHQTPTALGDEAPAAPKAGEPSPIASAKRPAGGTAGLAVTALIRAPSHPGLGQETLLLYKSGLGVPGPPSGARWGPSIPPLAHPSRLHHPCTPLHGPGPTSAPFHPTLKWGGSSPAPKMVRDVRNRDHQKAQEEVAPSLRPQAGGRRGCPSRPQVTRTRGKRVPTARGPRSAWPSACDLLTFREPLPGSLDPSQPPGALQTLPPTQGESGR